MVLLKTLGIFIFMLAVFVLIFYVLCYFSDNHIFRAKPILITSAFNAFITCIPCFYIIRDNKNKRHY